MRQIRALVVLTIVAALGAARSRAAPPLSSFLAFGRDATGAQAVLVRADGGVLLLHQSPFSIQEFDAQGRFLRGTVPTLNPPPAVAPGASALLSDGKLVLADPVHGRLLVWSDFGGQPEPHALTLDGKPLMVFQVAQGPDGTLYGATFSMQAGKSSIVRIDATTFTVQSTLLGAGSGGLSYFSGFAFGPDGDLYVSDISSGTVARFDGKTGAERGTFASIGRVDGGGLLSLKFDGEGALYAIERSSHSVLRFDPDGKTVRPAAPDGVLKQPAQLGLLPGGDLLVLDLDAHDLFRLPTKAKAVETASATTTAPSRAAVATTCLALLRPRAVAPAIDERAGLLARELLRQAVLMAARDAGAATRDAVLGEPVDIPACLSVEAQATVKNSHARLVLLRPAKPFPIAFATYELTLPGGTELDYVALSQTAERLTPSIARDLAKAGLVATRLSDEAAPSTPPVRLAVPARFVAARAAHGVLRSKPKDAAALRKLVLAYADLGWLLQPPTYSPAYKVFGARSLLYAQRMARTQAPGAALSRAYALALLGLPDAAARDLAEARAGADADPLFAVLQAYCDFDVARLMALGDGPEQSDLALTLAFDIVRHEPSTSLLEKLGAAVLAKNPDDLTVYRAFIEGASLGLQGRAAYEVSPRFEAALFSTLEAAPDLPAPVAQALGVTPGLDSGLKAVVQGIDRRVAGVLGTDHHDDALNLFLRAKVARLLVGAAAEDRGEPSWPILGRTALDESVLEVMDQVKYRRYQMGSPLGDELRRAEPLLAGNPVRGIADCYELDYARDPERYRKLLDSVEVEEPVPSFKKYADYLYSVGDPREKERASALQNRIQAAYDDIAGDLIRGVPGDALQRARRLQRVAPKSPNAVAWIVQLDWDAVAPGAKALETDFAAHPVVLSELAKAYSARQKWSDAERVLRRLVRQVPELWAYEMLADNALAQGHEDEWKAALDEFIALDPPGLAGAQARNKIARHFNQAGDFAKARPYAEAAAESYAGWAMSTASESCEGLRDYACSERWERAAAERYDNAATSWYMWCKRTGKGDEASAWKVAESHFISLGEHASYGDLLAGGVTALLHGDRVEARKRLARAFANFQSPHAGFLAAVLAKEQGDDLASNQTLDTITSKSASLKFEGAPPMELIQLAPLARDYLAGKSTSAALEQGATLVSSSAALPARTDFEYMLALCFEAGGDHEAAERHLLHVAADGKQGRWTTTVARATLRSLGKEPPQPPKPPSY
jgi:sugar lactone lactonase YvrE